MGSLHVGDGDVPSMAASMDALIDELSRGGWTVEPHRAFVIGADLCCFLLVHWWSACDVCLLRGSACVRIGAVSNAESGRSADFGFSMIDFRALLFLRP